MSKKKTIQEQISDISASHYLNRMIDCSDDDLCWCDSGLPFKDCHKNLSIRRKPIPGKIQKLFFDLKKKEMCLHPEKHDCDKKIIDAHSIQNSKSLDSISENGHVYRFEFKFDNMENLLNYQTILPEKIGKSRVSTFKGFCAFHDRELFREIDTKTIVPTEEQSMLLAIRSVAREIYTKDRSIDIEKITREIQSGSNTTLQAITQEMMGLHNAGSKLGLQDVLGHYAILFNIYKNKNYLRLNRLVIKIKEQPEILCSTCFFPEVNLQGDVLQKLDEVDYLEFMSFEVMSNGIHGIIQLCWYDNFAACKNLAESIVNSDDIPNSILKMVFAFSENHAFNIPWFDNLSVLKKKGIMKLVMLNTPLSIGSSELFKDRKKYVNWTVESLIKQY